MRFMFSLLFTSVSLTMTTRQWDVMSLLLYIDTLDVVSLLLYIDTLERGPSIRFEPSLQFTAVSLTIATKQQDVMSPELQPFYSVENCTCLPSSNTKGLCLFFCYNSMNVCSAIFLHYS